EQMDGVLAGTGTLRTERYGRIIPSAERRARRVSAGLAAEPLACVISHSGRNIPTEIPLFAEPEARIVVYSPVAPDLSEARAEVEVVRTDPDRDGVATAMRSLRIDHGVRA